MHTGPIGVGENPEVKNSCTVTSGSGMEVGTIPGRMVEQLTKHDGRPAESTYWETFVT